MNKLKIIPTRGELSAQNVHKVLGIFLDHSYICRIVCLENATCAIVQFNLAKVTVPITFVNDSVNKVHFYLYRKIEHFYASEPVMPLFAKKCCVLHILNLFCLTLFA